MSIESGTKSGTGATDNIDRWKDMKNHAESSKLAPKMRAQRPRRDKYDEEALQPTKARRYKNASGPGHPKCIQQEMKRCRGSKTNKLVQHLVNDISNVRGSVYCEECWLWLKSLPKCESLKCIPYESDAEVDADDENEDFFDADELEAQLIAEKMPPNVFGKICRSSGTFNECYLDESKDSFDPFEDSN